MVKVYFGDNLDHDITEWVTSLGIHNRVIGLEDKIYYPESRVDLIGPEDLIGSSKSTIMPGGRIQIYDRLNQIYDGWIQSIEESGQGGYSLTLITTWMRYLKQTVRPVYFQGHILSGLKSLLKAYGLSSSGGDNLLIKYPNLILDVATSGLETDTTTTSDVIEQILQVTRLKIIVAEGTAYLLGASIFEDSPFELEEHGEIATTQSLSIQPRGVEIQHPFGTYSYNPDAVEKVTINLTQNVICLYPDSLEEVAKLITENRVERLVETVIHPSRFSPNILGLIVKLQDGTTYEVFGYAFDGSLYNLTLREID